MKKYSAPESPAKSPELRSSEEDHDRVRRLHSIALTARTHEYEDVYSYRFVADEPIPFVAGQYLHLVAPNSEIDRSTVRHMSIASAPGEEEILFSMEHRSGSEYKQRFLEMQPGEWTQVFGITGSFTLDRSAHRAVLFLAGGIGITPVRSLVRAHGEAISWRLVHVARDGYLYADEFESLAAPQHRVNRSDAATAVESSLAAMRETEGDPWVFLSGGESFVDGMRSLLAGLSVSTERIAVELFD